MRVLEYTGLDTSRVRAQYDKIKRQLEADDLRSADLKKLARGGLYRARLDYANRLIARLMRHQGQRVALALEVVQGHAYDRSRFLRGARVDEDKIPPAGASEVEAETLAELAYLNPRYPRVHLLDKVLSLDDAQEAVYRLPAPLILIGSAGSGKTALGLEKLKLAAGDVLYVTLSAYLAQHARNLYFASGYAAEHQNADFLSLRELVETIHVPEGREVDYSAFRGFVARHRQVFATSPTPTSSSRSSAACSRGRRSRGRGSPGRATGSWGCAARSSSRRSASASTTSSRGTSRGCGRRGSTTRA